MSKFYNWSLEKVTLKSTTTRQCSTSKNDYSNSYLKSPSIHSYTTSDHLRNTTYEIYVPLVDNKWEDYPRIDGEEYLNGQNNRSTKQTLKKMYINWLKYFFRKKPFEEQRLYYSMSLEKVTLKSTTTRQCSTSKNDYSNSYLKSPSIHSYTTSDHLRNTTYEIYVPLVDNKWEDYPRIDGEEYLNGQNNRSTKQTLKKMYINWLKYFFRKKPFEEQRLYYSMNYLTREKLLLTVHLLQLCRLKKRRGGRYVIKYIAAVSVVSSYETLAVAIERT